MTPQALDITGQWIAYKAYKAVTATVAPNWADRSAVVLPTFTNGDTPAVFAFAFRPDGTYSYAAGQGQAQWSSQTGRYQVVEAKGTELYPYQVRLVPDLGSVKRTLRRDESLIPPGLTQLEQGARTFWLKRDSSGGFDLIDAPDAGPPDRAGFFWLRPAQR